MSDRRRAACDTFMTNLRCRTDDGNQCHLINSQPFIAAQGLSARSLGNCCYNRHHQSKWLVPPKPQLSACLFMDTDFSRNVRLKPRILPFRRVPLSLFFCCFFNLGWLNYFSCLVFRCVHGWFNYFAFLLFRFLHGWLLFFFPFL